MRSTVRIAASVIALTLAGGAVVTPAWAAAESWVLPPRDVSIPEVDLWASEGATAASDDGSLMTMWSEWGTSGELMARLWSDGAWADAPVSVTGDAPGLGDFALAARGDGSYVAVWTYSEENVDGDSYMTLRSSVFEEGAWSAPVILATSELGEEIEDLQLAAASDGAVIVAWVHVSNVFSVTRSGSTWASVRDLGEGRNPAVATAADGSVAVSWGASVAGVDGVPAVQVFNGSTWTATAYLSEGGGFSPILGASPTGFVAMWMEDSNDRLPRAATYTAPGGWSSTHVLRETNEIGGGRSSPGRIVSTPEGTVVTWNDGEYGNTAVQMAVFDGTSWSPTVRVLDGTEQAVEHTVAGAADGTFMIVWQANGGGALKARSFTATTLGEVFELSSTTGGLQARVTAGSNGYVVVVWVDAGAMFARLFDGDQWEAAEQLDSYTGTPFVAVTSQNVFYAGWEWYGEPQDRGVIRMTSRGTPEGPGGGDGSGGGELAETGSSPVAGALGIGGAGLLLLGAAMLAASRRPRAASAR